MSSYRWCRLAAGLTVAIAAVTAGRAQAPALAMLDHVEPGRWEIRERGAPQASQSFCLASARRLVQLRHPGQSCESIIVADGPGEVIVQYTCRGHGYGRTHIRRETGRILQVESQGIAEGFPFEIVAEARRVADCPG